MQKKMKTFYLVASFSEELLKSQKLDVWILDHFFHLNNLLTGTKQKLLVYHYLRQLSIPEAGENEPSEESADEPRPRLHNESENTDEPEIFRHLIFPSGFKLLSLDNLTPDLWLDTATSQRFPGMETITAAG